MSSFIKFSVLLLVIIHTIGANTPCSSCGSNEIFTDCGNRCLESCNTGPATLCAVVCEIGCFCAPNFKRKNNRCVPENECGTPQSCPFENMEWRYGNECRENCLKPKKGCPRGREYNCHCKKPLKWDPNAQKCVSLSECSTTAR